MRRWKYGQVHRTCPYQRPFRLNDHCIQSLDLPGNGLILAHRPGCVRVGLVNGGHEDI